MTEKYFLQVKEPRRNHYLGDGREIKNVANDEEAITAAKEIIQKIKQALDPEERETFEARVIKVVMEEK